MKYLFLLPLFFALNVFSISEQMVRAETEELSHSMGGQQMPAGFFDAFTDACVSVKEGFGARYEVGQLFFQVYRGFESPLDAINNLKAHIEKSPGTNPQNIQDILNLLTQANSA